LHQFSLTAISWWRLQGFFAGHEKLQGDFATKSSMKASTDELKNYSVNTVDDVEKRFNNIKSASA
jgi:hypothetical protein